MKLSPHYIKNTAQLGNIPGANFSPFVKCDRFTPTDSVNPRGGHSKLQAQRLYQAGNANVFQNLGSYAGPDDKYISFMVMPGLGKRRAPLLRDLPDSIAIEGISEGLRLAKLLNSPRTVIARNLGPFRLFFDRTGRNQSIGHPHDHVFVLPSSSQQHNKNKLQGMEQVTREGIVFNTMSMYLGSKEEQILLQMYQDLLKQNTDILTSIRGGLTLKQHDSGLTVQLPYTDYSKVNPAKLYSKVIKPLQEQYLVLAGKYTQGLTGQDLLAEYTSILNCKKSLTDRQFQELNATVDKLKFQNAKKAKRKSPELEELYALWHNDTGQMQQHLSPFLSMTMVTAKDFRAGKLAITMRAMPFLGGGGVLQAHNSLYNRQNVASADFQVLQGGLTDILGARQQARGNTIQFNTKMLRQAGLNLL